MALATKGCLILRYCRVSRSISSSGGISPKDRKVLRSRVTAGGAAVSVGASSLASGASGTWAAGGAASPADCCRCSCSLRIVFSTTLISEAPGGQRQQSKDGQSHSSDQES